MYRLTFITDYPDLSHLHAIFISGPSKCPKVLKCFPLQFSSQTVPCCIPQPTSRCVINITDYITFNVLGLLYSQCLPRYRAISLLLSATFFRSVVTWQTVWVSPYSEMSLQPLCSNSLIFTHTFNAPSLSLLTFPSSPVRCNLFSLLQSLTFSRISTCPYFPFPVSVHPMMQL